MPPLLPLRVLVVPDKFKGTLTATQAARSMARGWRTARPTDRLEVLPMSDGGDGFGQVVSALLCARPRLIRTFDAAHCPRRSHWWWETRTRTAIVESAEVIGLAQLPPGRYHPFELDTSGLGPVLEAAVQAGARRLLVGVGGSATNDGGFGVARALGWRFLDRQRQPIERWTGLRHLAHLEPPRIRPLLGARVVVAVDVQNRLLGPHGCSRVYGPQKGLRPADLPAAEGCLRRLAHVVEGQLGTDLASIPGSGAAGGLGFGLMAFAGARLESGPGLFARHARLGRRLRRAELVLTGEGALDRSTLMGKGVGEIAGRCRAWGIPCVGLAGVAVDRPALLRRFVLVRALVELTTPEEARRHAGRWLTRLAFEVASRWPVEPGRDGIG
jgi:glycerate kinase